MKSKFIAFITSIFVGLCMCTGCQNELSFPDSGVQKEQINLVQMPDIYAYSGNNFISTYATRSSSETGSFERWQSDRSWARPNDIIEPERDYVLDYLQKNPGGGYKTLDIDTYVIQVVGGGHHSYKGDTADHNGTWHTVSDATNEMNYCEIDGFFTQFNNAHEMNSEQPILIKNVKATDATYHDSYSNSTWKDHYAFYYITFPDDEYYGYMAGQTGLYLCYDYATYKNSENWGVTADGVYDDWVIKLSPSQGGFFDVPAGGSGDNNGSANGANGSLLIEQFKDNHVEINLSIEERPNIKWLASHLSIHVRAVTNVEVFIKIPVDYYCAVDDLAIVNKHEKGLMIHDGPVKASYNINGNEVILTANFEDDGIRITTEGINEDVIKYCADQFGDGLTFEVWNYFNITKAEWNHGLLESDGKNPGAEHEITVEELRDNLNGSSVKFLGPKIPGMYVNAFMSDGDHVFEDDCTVIPEGWEQTYETGWFYNGSFYNHLYFNN